jgi:hypothetical protein
MAGIVFSFGRMQPFTIGHQHLVKCMQEIATERNYQCTLFLSQTNKNKQTDPLPWDIKVDIVKGFCPELNISTDVSIKTPFMALEHLCKLYSDIVLVVGSDRSTDFEASMTKYASEWGAKSFTVVVAGDRNGNTLIESANASAAREYAKSGKYDKFAEMMPGNLSVTRKTYELLRNELTKV